jgi:predicted Rossmann-fold nucleotide-binding protein
MFKTPHNLYTADDLLAGFDHADPLGFAKSFDFVTFRQFVRDGAASPKDLAVREAEAIHDASIADALRRYLLDNDPRLVGFMGGHNLRRDEPAYEAVARLARELTRNRFMIASGGGPGAMEAAHLGALFAPAADGDLDAAMGTLRAEPRLPNLNDLLDSNGDINAGREDDLRAAQRWLIAALDVRKQAPQEPGASLAIPTWLYGQEPTMPFATAYAKYFQNSIREEALVSDARAGIIYARGGGGTIREIFEDLEQNYYAASAADFTPMIFFDVEHYWERPATYGDNGKPDAVGVRLDTVVSEIVRFARAGSADGTECLRKIRFTTSTQAIVALLDEHAPQAQREMHALLANDTESLTKALWNR